MSSDYPVAYEVLDESCGWISSLNDMSALLSMILVNEHGMYQQKKTSVLNYRYSNRRMIEAIDKVFCVA